NASFAPGAPICIVDIQPPVNLNCILTSQYLLASYQTDVMNPVFDWTLNSVSIGAGINDTANGLDSILITLPGTYRFTVHDTVNPANNCFAEVTVLQDSTPPSCNINVSGPAPCAGGPAVLTASGGDSFLWSTGATTDTITVTPSVNTTYTVTVTNA